MKLRALFNYILVGAMGGFLIFIGMLMFNTVLSLLVPTGQGTMLFFLAFSSLVVGILARLLQPFHGVGTALASGGFAALIILYLWLVTSADAMSMVFGPLGLLISIAFCPLGALLLPNLRKWIGRRAGKTS
ncbi:MAG: hypothetical protein ABSG01_13555 [Anaerolineales bacterium]|jgi:hypothetical protein